VNEVCWAAVAAAMLSSPTTRGVRACQVACATAAPAPSSATRTIIATTSVVKISGIQQQHWATEVQTSTRRESAESATRPATRASRTNGIRPAASIRATS